MIHHMGDAKALTQERRNLFEQLLGVLFTIVDKPKALVRHILESGSPVKHRRQGLGRGVYQQILLACRQSHSHSPHLMMAFVTAAEATLGSSLRITAQRYPVPSGPPA